MTRKRNTDVMHSMAGKSDIFICVVDNLMRLISELTNRLARKGTYAERVRSALGRRRLQRNMSEKFLILLQRDMYGDILGLLPRVLPE